MAVENQRLNQARLVALTQQTDRAKRLYAMGQGTVTDQRDLEVKLAQARAQHLLLTSQVESAAKQYAAIVGERPRVAEFVLQWAQSLADRVRTSAAQALVAYGELGAG